MNENQNNGAPLNEAAKQHLLKDLLDSGKAAGKLTMEEIGVLIDELDMDSDEQDKLFETTVSRNVKLSESPSFGLPVYYHSKRSKGALEYINIAKELAERI
mgnify:CR=1 FL=1